MNGCLQTTKVDNYKLKVELKPVDEIREASYKNNELEVDVSAVTSYYNYSDELDRALDF